MAAAESHSYGDVSGPYNFDYVTVGDVYGLAIAIPILAIAVVGLRFFVRSDRKVGFGIDDWLLLPALTTYIALCIILLIGASHNIIGEHENSFLQLSPPNPLHDYVLPTIPLFAKLQFSFQIFLVLSNCFIKLSTIALYQRIFSTRRSSTFNMVCHATHVVVMAWALTFFLLDILACPSDPSAQWSSDGAIQNMRCTVAFGAGEALVISDLILDIWLIVLPQPLIWRLQMSRSKKVMVTGIIILGTSCVGFSAARVAMFSELQEASRAGQLLDRNQIVSVNLWFAALDAGVGLIACCLPTLRPLIRDLSVRKVFGVLTGSYVFGKDGSDSMTSMGMSTGESKRRSNRFSSRKLRLKDEEKGEGGRDRDGGDKSVRLLPLPWSPRTPKMTSGGDTPDLSLKRADNEGVDPGTAWQSPVLR